MKSEIESSWEQGAAGKSASFHEPLREALPGVPRAAPLSGVWGGTHKAFKIK